MNLRRCALLVALTACTPDDDEPPKPPVERMHVMTMTPNLDLLVVVDDSASMADKQNAFNVAFPALLAELQAADGGLPNLHLGVTSTDLGTSASGTGTPAPPIGAIGQGGCADVGNGGKLLVGAAPVSGKYLEASRDGSDNFTGTLAGAFAQMASLGSRGCGFEQQLGAMKMALDNNPNNAGFVRANANLGVIVLTDEDDCSAASPTLFAAGTELGNLDSFRCFRHGVECAEDTATVGVKTQCKPRAASPYVADVAPFRDFLVGLKQGEARRVMFGSVIGDPTKVEVETRSVAGNPPQLALKHSCDYTTAAGPAVADPGVRLATLAKSFARAKQTSICNDDLSSQAAQLGAALRGLVNDTCLDAELPAAADCVVTDHFADGTTADVAFHFADDSACAGKRRVVIDRPSVAAFDTWSTLSCAMPSL